MSLSPTFYAWVFQFGGAMKILTPEKAVSEITEMAKRLADGKYCTHEKKTGRINYVCSYVTKFKIEDLT